jgi:hypothetical protein
VLKIHWQVQYPIRQRVAFSRKRKCLPSGSGSNQSKAIDRLIVGCPYNSSHFLPDTTRSIRVRGRERVRHLAEGQGRARWVIRPLITNFGVVVELCDLSITPHGKISVVLPTMQRMLLSLSHAPKKQHKSCTMWYHLCLLCLFLLRVVQLTSAQRSALSPKLNLTLLPATASWLLRGFGVNEK